MDLTAKQKQALALVSSRPQMTAQEVADEMGYTVAASAVNILRGLVQKGAITEAEGLVFSVPAPPKREKAPRAKRPAAKKEAAPKASRQQPEILGHPVSRLVRWMGKDGWTTQQAVEVLEANGITMGRRSVGNLLSEGRMHEARKEPISELTKAEAAEIRKLRKAVA